ncbi:FO synthase subunit 1 [Durusdinium trenchii]
MKPFLTHETISREIFNLAFSSGVGALEAWNGPLTNKEDNEIVVLLIERMASDWDRTAPNMRKAWGYKDTLALHAATGGFLQFLRVLKEKLPGAEYDKHRDNLMAQFRLGALDPDIVHSLETTVPPGSLDSVSFLRPGAALCVLVPPKRII